MNPSSNVLSSLSFNFLTASKLDKITKVAIPIMAFYGAWSCGRLLLAGVMGTSKGVVVGLVITPECDDNIVDKCFDAVERAGTYIWHKSIAAAREGLKGAVLEIAHESSLMVTLPHWCRFYTRPNPQPLIGNQSSSEVESATDVSSSPVIVENTMPEVETISSSDSNKINTSNPPGWNF